MSRQPVEITVNGDRRQVSVLPWRTLAEVLRDESGLMGAKIGCNQLDNNPAPSERQTREGLSGNLCRCTGYNKIVEAIADAASKPASAHKEA